jgi:hypothetical protein
MVTWTPDANPDIYDLAPDDMTIRPGILPDDHPLSAARGCIFGLLFALPCWGLLAVGLFALGWLIAGVRLP